MSVETDIAEIKQTMVYLTERISDSIVHSKEICSARHKDIDLHLIESPKFRDMIIDMAGRVGLLTAIVLLLIAGVLSIAWKVLS